MKKHTLAVLFLASSVLSAAAYAECDEKGHKKGGHKKHGAKHFTMIDTNEDGKLSKEEMLQYNENHFTKVDADGDGFISKDEMKAQHKGKKKRFMKMDTNNDGEVSDEEKAAFKEKRKNRKADTDDEQLGFRVRGFYFELDSLRQVIRDRYFQTGN